jgi:hypothetical protein
VGHGRISSVTDGFPRSRADFLGHGPISSVTVEISSVTFQSGSVTSVIMHPQTLDVSSCQDHPRT